MVSYTQDGEGKWRGAAEVKRVLQAATKHDEYESVFFLGDSMGASACLRFARFADLCIAFSPQVTGPLLPTAERTPSPHS